MTAFNTNNLSECLKIGIESMTDTNKCIFNDATTISDDASDKLLTSYKAEDIKKFLESIRNEELILKFLYGFEVPEKTFKRIAGNDRVKGIEYDKYLIQKRDKDDNLIDVMMIRNKVNVLSERINLVSLIESMDIKNKQIVLNTLTAYESAYQNVIKAPDTLTIADMKELKTVLATAKKSWDSVKPIEIDELLKEVNESEKAFNEDYAIQKQEIAKVKNIAKNAMDNILLKEIKDEKSKRTATAANLREKFAGKLTNDKDGKVKGIKY